MMAQTQEFEDAANEVPYSSESEEELKITQNCTDVVFDTGLYYTYFK